MWANAAIARNDAGDTPAAPPITIDVGPTTSTADENPPCHLVNYYDATGDVFGGYVVKEHPCGAADVHLTVLNQTVENVRRLQDGDDRRDGYVITLTNPNLSDTPAPTHKSGQAAEPEHAGFTNTCNS